MNSRTKGRRRGSASTTGWTPTPLRAPPGRCWASRRSFRGPGPSPQPSDDLMQITRRTTRQITVGNVKIGGDAPIVVQSMTTCDTDKIDATVAEIHALEQVGCELIRVTVNTPAAADALPEIKRQIHLPLIADIHFDYKLALRALEAG